MKVCSAYSQARMERRRPHEAGRPGDSGVSQGARRPRRSGHLHRPSPDGAADGDDRPGPLLLRHHHRDQVEHSKPDPEIYLLACQALGTDPEYTIAVEDSRTASSPPPGRACRSSWYPT